MSLWKARRTTILLTAMAAFAMTALAADPGGCAVSASDEPQVVEAMRAFYVALSADDLARFHSVIGPKFYAYDGGRRFEGDALLNLIKAGHAAGRTYVWTVTEPEVHVTCDTAWISYVNRGSAGTTSGPNPGTNSVVWLESAFLQKEAGHWRISFFHSTRVP